jgi:hypothetical protein
MKFKPISFNSTTADSQTSSDQAGPPATNTTTSDGDADDKMFCERLIHEIEINRKGRFLEWNRSLSIWVHMKTDTKKSLGKLRQKILIFIYNYEKKASTSLFLLRRKIRNREANDSTMKRNIAVEAMVTATIGLSKEAGNHSWKRMIVVSVTVAVALRDAETTIPQTRHCFRPILNFDDYHTLSIPNNSIRRL